MLRFSLLSLLPFLVSYLAIAVQIEPYTTDLKITLNDIVVEGRRTRYIVYTSVVEYDEVTTDFHNEQLAGLCKQGTFLDVCVWAKYGVYTRKASDFKILLT